nr:hypothetical protein [Tanacetum cinerariifolium]
MRKVPPCFGTNKAGTAHGLILSRIKPFSTVGRLGCHRKTHPETEIVKPSELIRFWVILNIKAKLLDHTCCHHVVTASPINDYATLQCQKQGHLQINISMSKD